jgi:hypothetical protein
MAKRLDWEKNKENRKAKTGYCIVDEQEFRSRVTAARWLQGAEEWYARVARREAVARRKAKKKRAKLPWIK